MRLSTIRAAAVGSTFATRAAHDDDHEDEHERDERDGFDGTVDTLHAAAGQQGTTRHTPAGTRVLAGAERTADGVLITVPADA